MEKDQLENFLKWLLNEAETVLSRRNLWWMMMMMTMMVTAVISLVCCHLLFVCFVNVNNAVSDVPFFLRCKEKEEAPSW